MWLSPYEPCHSAKNIDQCQRKEQPICIYEISDNGFPIFLWWIAIPLNFIMALLITPFVRPLTLEQIIFTYLIPIIPFFFAWDGAVSNARTYTIEDMDILLEGIETKVSPWNTKKGQVDIISHDKTCSMNRS
ncbi:MAG: hypothetical protein M3R08_02245 [Bacteroidota bacterium]|nr:hypothetical protein [Bacteroidota bacterium]